MPSTIVITCKSEKTQAELQQRFQLETGKPREEMRALVDLLRAAGGGIEALNVDVQTGGAAPVAASGTFTLSSVAENDTVVIGAVTLTAKAAPATENQWSQAGSNDADAAALTAKINAHSVLSKVVKATVLTNVVTVAALVKGEIGNQIAIAETGSSITASGSFLAGGTGGAGEAGVNYHLGIS